MLQKPIYVVLIACKAGLYRDLLAAALVSPRVDESESMARELNLRHPHAHVQMSWAGTSTTSSPRQMMPVAIALHHHSACLGLGKYQGKGIKHRSEFYF